MDCWGVRLIREQVVDYFKSMGTQCQWFLIVAGGDWHSWQKFWDVDVVAIDVYPT